jgi:hypothetical protein
MPSPQLDAPARYDLETQLGGFNRDWHGAE